MALSISSKLKDLLADERAREILIKHLGERNDPRVNEVMYYSLREIAYYPEANISKAQLDAIEEELKAL
jgi:hypothetical protein